MTPFWFPFFSLVPRLHGFGRCYLFVDKLCPAEHGVCKSKERIPLLSLAPCHEGPVGSDHQRGLKAATYAILYLVIIVSPGRCKGTKVMITTPSGLECLSCSRSSSGLICVLCELQYMYKMSPVDMGLPKSGHCFPHGNLKVCCSPTPQQKKCKIPRFVLPSSPCAGS
jgi:hypothetical protein